MAKIDVSTARTKLSELIELSQTQAVEIERDGEAAAVVISPDRHEELLTALDELEDVRAFDEAMAEEGDSMPWKQVKSDFGWL